MNPPSLSSRGTPSARTPDSGVARVASEGRASRAMARAVGQLVDRIMAMGPDSTGVMGGLDGVDPLSPPVQALREAIRHVAACSREGALLCRVVDQSLVLEGVPIARESAQADPTLRVLLDRLLALKVASLTVREGAAPGELLTLGRLLAQPFAPRDMRTPAHGAPGLYGDTPTTVHVVDYAGETPRELLRTWSVLVTPMAPEREQTARSTDGAPGAVAGTAASVIARVGSARTDDAAAAVLDSLKDVLDDVQRHGDATALEGIGRACLLQVQSVGNGGGRLALEGAIRQLLRAPLLDLLAKRLPASADRVLLLQLFARAGDAGVSTLVHHLMSTDDALSRRVYFDSIVAIDVGSVELFDALSDSRWFVVRNAAALLGEMGVAHADDVLIPLLRRDDERIHIAAARALMRLRSSKAMQALHAVIDDPSAEVRRLSAAAFGLAGASTGGGVRPPAARLSAALDREMDDDVALEMLAALGRLGSADAIQRLLRLAMPASTDMSGEMATQRESWIRIAALEALVRARGAQMQPVVEQLLNDSDPEVALAARGLSG